MNVSFKLLCEDPHTYARRGELTTAHGVVQTPVFMSVGTFGAVRTLPHHMLEEIGTQIILGNTYHLYLRPGEEILKKIGGLHSLNQWRKPILTDSGGFQVFSLAHQRKIEENGVCFTSYIDGKKCFFTPENNIAFQEVIHSDIMMCLDVCVPSTSERPIVEDAMKRTHRWATRCLDARKTQNGLFGICQGALFEDLRKESAGFISELPFDGYAIGGLAVGESQEERDHFTEFTAKLLPREKPRYLMGVGTPEDLIKAVKSGVDMFDCIIPTNHSRQGVAYSWNGKVQLRRTAFASDMSPIDENCDCFVCRRYSKAYIHQLIKCAETTGWVLLSYHNTWFYERLMEAMRLHIEKGTFEEFYRQYEPIFRRP